MPVTVESARLRARVTLDDQQVHIRLTDRESDRVWADGPYQYSVQTAAGAPASGLQSPSLKRVKKGVVVTGTIRGTSIGVTHRLETSGDGIEERIEFRNLGHEVVRLDRIALGFSKSLVSTDSMRLVACPFRRQADAKVHDYSTSDLLARRFSNSDGHNDAAVTDNQICDSDVLRSEAWILADRAKSLLVAKYNPDHIECSVASVDQTTQGSTLRFGGAGLSLFHEPRPATLLKAGEVFRFGLTSLQDVAGGWEAAYGAYREFLSSEGHGMPSDYAPPLNWNELFDVGWYHSDAEKLAKHYTREAIMAEAAKAKEIGCDLLYLDPGWGVCEGTTLWDEKRLGKVEDFSREIRERFGLRFGYRTIGRVYRNEFPDAWYLRRENTTGT